MPGRFFEITANPTTATVAPGGTAQLTYKVKNIMGRPVSAQFVIVPPSPTEGSWTQVSNGALRQFTLDGSQDFVVAVSPGPATPEDPTGASHQFAVYVKATENPAATFDQGPPFTITVKGTHTSSGVAGGQPWWRKLVIPGAIGVGVLIVVAVLFSLLKPHSKGQPFPNLVGLPVVAALDSVQRLTMYVGNVSAVLTSSTADSGTIASQTPPAAQLVSPGDTATLTYKEYHPATTPPPPCFPRCRPLGTATINSHTKALMEKMVAHPGS